MKILFFVENDEITFSIEDIRGNELFKIMTKVVNMF